MSQAGAVTCPFDQPGQVGDGHAPLVAGVCCRQVEHAQVGFERRERIWRDLRSGRGQRSQQGRFAGIGEADETDVGDQSKLQLQPALLPRLALLGVGRRLVCRGRKVSVAQPAAAAARDHDALLVSDEVRDQLVGCQVTNDRARRHAEIHVVAGFAVLLGARATTARFGTEVTLVAEVPEHRFARIDAHVDAATASAVTTIGSAARHVCLMPEARCTVTASPGADGDRYFIEEHGFESYARPPPAGTKWHEMRVNGRPRRTWMRPQRTCVTKSGPTDGRGPTRKPDSRQLSRKACHSAPTAAKAASGSHRPTFDTHRVPRRPRPPF